MNNSSSMLRKLTELISVNRTISGVLDYDEVLRLVVDSTAAFMRADACMLLLADGPVAVTVAAATGVGRQRGMGFAAPLDEHIHAALRTFFSLTDADTLWSSPLAGRDDLRGILAVYRRAQPAGEGGDADGPGADLPEHDARWMLCAIADQAAIALSHALACREAAKAAEQALRTSEEKLRACTKKLDEADRRTNEFLAMLGHELRNPLAPVLGAVQALRLEGSTPAAQERAERIIERQVRHMARLLDSLLDIARITHGKIVLSKRPVCLDMVIAEAVEMLRPDFDARGQKLHIALTPEQIWLDADPDRLVQVLANLLNNAARYTGAGGEIRLCTDRAGDKAIMRIRDSGIGISADLLPDIFDLFAQGERPVDRSDGGLGVGLTLVQELVKLHGGSVHAHSEGKGCGSEFVVTLPVTTAPVIPVHTSPQENGRSEEKPAGVLDVLVVDDNVDITDVFAELLKIAGHRPRVAHDGPAAIVAVREHPPDVILLDIGLPGMDGCQVALRLREEHGENTPVLVALTGYGRADLCQTKSAGFAHHLVKPAEWHDLERILAGITPRVRTEAPRGG